MSDRGGSRADSGEDYEKDVDKDSRTKNPTAAAAVTSNANVAVRDNAEDNGGTDGQRERNVDEDFEDDDDGVVRHDGDDGGRSEVGGRPQWNGDGAVDAGK